MTKRFCLLYLIHGSELSEFAENSVRSLRNSGFDLDVVVYCTDRTAGSVADWASRYRVTISPIEEGRAQSVDTASYSDYGTPAFNKVTSLKWHIILQTLELGYDCAIYSDVDIYYLRNFTDYLSNAMKVYRCGVQSESQPQFPARYCTGFMFFTREAKQLLQQFDGLNAQATSQGNDQTIFNNIMRNNPHLIREIMILPEGLFQNGLFHQAHTGPHYPSMSQKLSPFLFHANWCLGIEAKRKLLQHLGMWGN